MPPVYLTACLDWIRLKPWLVMRLMLIASLIGESKDTFLKEWPTQESA